MKFRDIELNQTKESEKRKLGFAFNRKFYRAGLAVLLSLSLQSLKNGYMVLAITVLFL